MDYPVNRLEAEERISQGRLIQVMINTPGYRTVYKAALDLMLKKADTDCHNLRIREDRGKAAVVRYNAIEEIMDVCNYYITNMETAIQWMKDNPDED